MDSSNIRDVAKTVTVASTAEALVSSTTYARGVCLQARKVAGSNTGNVFIGISSLDQGVREMLELEPGDYWEPPGPPGSKINLADIYIDADNAADGVVGLYFT